MNTVALAAIQGFCQVLDEEAAEMAALRRQNERMEVRLELLEKAPARMAGTVDGTVR